VPLEVPAVPEVVPDDAVPPVEPAVIKPVPDEVVLGVQAETTTRNRNPGQLFGMWRRPRE
jgi:hypothetical protein